MRRLGSGWVSWVLTLALGALATGTVQARDGSAAEVAASAGDAATVMEMLSPAARCLTPSIGDASKPEYPADMLRMKRGARVRIELVDATAMKCPFDVRLKFRQPYARNVVSEPEADVPARHAFLDWLARQELDTAALGQQAAAELIDQTMTIHVPCATIDL